MVKKTKSNIIIILSFLILLSILIYSSYSSIKEMNSIKNKNEEYKQFCLNDDYLGTPYEHLCEDAINAETLQLDFFTAYMNILVFGIGKITFVLFLFIVMPALLYISKYLKNKKIMNDLTRISYKKVKLKLFASAYKSVLILPTIIFIAFCISYIYTKTFNPAFAISKGTVGWSESTLYNPILFLSAYLLNVIVHSILYVNIALCVVRKYHNYFVAVILSFLIFIGIEAILEIGFNAILFTIILKSGVGMVFNIMNMIAFNDGNGIFLLLLIPMLIMILSFIILYFLYKDKEKLIIACEGNE